MPHTDKRIKQFIQSIEAYSHQMLGYPSARDFDYTALAPLLNFPLNNVGDPFVEGSMQVNSRRSNLKYWRSGRSCFVRPRTTGGVM